MSGLGARRSFRRTGAGPKRHLRQPLGRVRLLDVPVEEMGDYTPADIDREETRSVHRATLAASGKPFEGKHMVMLDIDAHVEVYESSTPGHHHLYIRTPVEWDTYAELLGALANAGVIEHGYAEASIRRGFTSLRMPWIKKMRRRQQADQALEKRREERAIEDTAAVERATPTLRPIITHVGPTDLRTLQKTVVMSDGSSSKVGVEFFDESLLDPW